MTQPDTRTGAEPGPSAQAAQPEPHAQSPAAERNRGPQTLRSMLSFSERVDLLIRVVLAVAVSIGCYFIIEPRSSSRRFSPSSHGRSSRAPVRRRAAPRRCPRS